MLLSNFSFLPDPESILLFKDERDPERLSLHIFIWKLCKKKKRNIAQKRFEEDPCCKSHALRDASFFFFTSSIQKLDIFCAVSVTDELLLHAEAPDVDNFLHVRQVLIFIVHPSADGALSEKKPEGSAWQRCSVKGEQTKCRKATI